MKTTWKTGASRVRSSHGRNQFFDVFFFSCRHGGGEQGLYLWRKAITCLRKRAIRCMLLYGLYLLPVGAKKNDDEEKIFEVGGIQGWDGSYANYEMSTWVKFYGILSAFRRATWALLYHFFLSRVRRISYIWIIMVWWYLYHGLRSRLIVNLNGPYNYPSLFFFFFHISEGS